MIRLLLVDDDARYLSALQTLLEPAFPGADVSVATTFASVRTLWSQEQFDLVVTDYELPDGTGVDVVTELRTREAEYGRTRRATIIGLTGYADDGTVRHDLLDAGCTDVLAKSAVLDNLSRMVSEVQSATTTAKEGV